MHSKDKVSIIGNATGSIRRMSGCSAIVMATIAAALVAGCDTKEPPAVPKTVVSAPKATAPQQLVLQMDQRVMMPEKGLAFTYPVPQLVGEADIPEQASRSPYTLTEDGKALEPPHSVHEDIRKVGKGHWSHWGATIYFSSSDGSDPRQNNRKYVLLK